MQAIPLNLPMENFIFLSSTWSERLFHSLMEKFREAVPVRVVIHYTHFDTGEEIFTPLQMVICKLHCYLHKRLFVLTLVGITLKNVFIWCFIQMIFNVMESVMCNIGNLCVGVPLYITFLWINLPNKKLNHC